jgi:glycyl-tRNA synthetase
VEVKKAMAAGDEKAKEKENFRSKMGSALEQRLFYIPSFKIYGGVAGFFDYGPPGCAVKSNLQAYWRQHFVLNEQMLEVECPAVTPEVVLQASGHVERFTDLMVNDVVTKDCFRADHLVEENLEKIMADPMITPERRRELEDMLARLEEFTPEEMGAAIVELGIKAPDTKNDLTAPYPFNLMFPTQIGPSGVQRGFLRPETAQGIFVNFRDLLYYNGGKLPFAAAQIGQSFRNEIAPRAGLLRVREFTQAEIEHFVHPDHKEHPRFHEIKDVELSLFSREAQLGAVKKPFPMSAGDAIAKGVIANETLGYFIARTQLFLLKVGINPARLRFRQHLQHEMAHYAEDCWDAEIECTYGWVECVGLADRSAFDLKAHSVKSGIELVAHERFAEPKMVEELVVEPNKQVMGKAFKKDAKAVTDALFALCQEDALALDAAVRSDGKALLKIASGDVDILPGMVKIAMETKKVSGRNFTPSVIEPSFGIGRIMYCMFEHSFYVRKDDEQKTVFAFSPVIAPIKCTIFPLVNDPAMNELSNAISRELSNDGVSTKLDTTAVSVGKRYARTDELGVPFAVTVDHRSLEDNTVTVRERDSCEQIRVKVEDVLPLVKKLCAMQVTWEEATAGMEKQAATAE